MPVSQTWEDDMIKTRITELLGIEHPIIQGGMQWIATAEFAAAVSNAGGLGIMTALSCASGDELRSEIRKCKSLTDKPFGVNVSMLPVVTFTEIYDEYFSIVADEKVKVVETSGRNPEQYLPILKKAGVKVIHKVPAVRFAKKAEAVGADAVTIVGVECGGHPGMDEVTSLILVPKAAESIKVPLIAGGGFCDGKGLVAALALGAEAILMGTRFMATQECAIHQNFKDWMVKAEETDTMLVERSIKNAARVRRNKAAEEVLELEKGGAGLNDLMPLIAGKIGREAYLSGDLDMGVIACGQTVGRIRNIPTIKELIQEIMSEAEGIIKSLPKKL